MSTFRHLSVHFLGKDAPGAYFLLQPVENVSRNFSALLIRNSGTL
jgi:hypothetical protein